MWNLSKLGSECLIRNDLYRKCIRGIFLVEDQIVPVHAAPRALLGSGAEANMKTILSHEAIIIEQNKHALIPVVRLIMIPA